MSSPVNSVGRAWDSDSQSKEPEQFQGRGFEPHIVWTFFKKDNRVKLSLVTFLNFQNYYYAHGLHAYTDYSVTVALWLSG